MKYLIQFSILILLSFTGEILSTLLPLPIPASIYGIAILFLCLEFKIIKPDSVKETSHFLIDIMPVMFIPAAVGIINSWERIKESWFSYITITFVSTFIVMTVSGLVTSLCIERNKKEKDKKIYE